MSKIPIKQVIYEQFAPRFAPHNFAQIMVLGPSAALEFPILPSNKNHPRKMLATGLTNPRFLLHLSTLLIRARPGSACFSAES